MKISSKNYLAALVIGLILMPQIALAASACTTENVLTIVPKECRDITMTRDSKGNVVDSCGVEQMLCAVVNVSRLILGLVGSAALIMFVYGGFMWLISSGSAERVKKGRDTFVNAIIGIVIIFGSWIIINVVVAALSGQSLSGDIFLFRNGGNNSQPVRPFEIPATPTN
jgi:hypothetical protein